MAVLLKNFAKQEDNRTKTKTNEEDNWFEMEIYAAWQFSCLKSVQSRKTMRQRQIKKTIGLKWKYMHYGNSA